jgi:hypothetical protein
MFITILTANRQTSLPSATWIQFTRSHEFCKIQSDTRLPSTPMPCEFLVPLDFQIQILQTYAPCVLHFPSISFSLLITTIIFGEECNLWSSWSRNCFQSPVTHSSWFQIFSSAPCPQTSWINHPSMWGNKLEKNYKITKENETILAHETETKGNMN